MEHISKFLHEPEDYSYYSLLASRGWEDLGKQKSQHLISFKKGNKRMNIYNTGTITIQDTTKRYDKGISYKEMTPIKLKEIL